MQSISIYLLPIKIDAYTNLTDSWINERYRRVYNRTLKLFRGVDNRIDLTVKNSDQKSASVSGRNIVLTLIERETQKKVYEKDCTIIDPTGGRCRITVEEHELDHIESGFYDFTLRAEQRQILTDGNYKIISSLPLYTDSQYDVVSTIEVSGSVQGEPEPSVEIKEFNEIKDFSLNSSYFTSDIIDARPRTSNPQKLHTFQFFPVQYLGDVTIQASLDENATPDNWFDLDTFEIVETDSSVYKNITGKYNWFRIKHVPGKASAVAEFVVAQTILLSYVVSIRTPGLGYSIGNIISISGRILGGESPTNDLTITVTDVDADGRILDISWSGVSYNGVKTFVTTGVTNTGTFDKILYR